MYLKTILCAVILGAVISTVHPLNCFLCVGPPKGGCARANLNDLAKQKCSQREFFRKLPEAAMWDLDNEIDSSLNASCVQFVISDRRTNLTIFDRSCAVVPSRWKACKFLQRHLHVQKCYECTTNYCNNKTMTELTEF